MPTSAGDLAGWAPRTKLVRPRTDHAVVLDPALVASARRALDRARLTLISAQAGAGKTTLAGALLDAAPEQPAAWISLDEGDDDLASLLHLLAGALATVVPGGCPALADLLRLGLPAAADPRRAVGVLVNDVLAADPPPFVVVLDDLHVLRDDAVVAALDYLLAYAPPCLRLLATARGDPPLALARLRAAGQLHELRGEDLRFDVDQAEELLNRRLGLGLPTADVERVVATTAGWIVGVRLFAQALARGRPGAAELLEAAAERAGLSDYLTDEVLRAEPADVRRFLLDTAILEEVTPAAAAAVTGRADAADLLEALHRRNHLLIARAGPDDYRYHDLLASYLRRRLAADGADRIAELHRRAAGAVDHPAARVDHLLAAGQGEAAADLIERLGRELFARPVEIGRLAGWVRRLPAGTQAGRPWLTVIRGLAAAQRADLRPVVADLEAALDALEAADDPLGQCLAARLLHLATMGSDRVHAAIARVEASPRFVDLPIAARVDHFISTAYAAAYGGDWAATGRRLATALDLTADSADLGAVEVLVQHLSPFLAAADGALARVEAHADWTARRFPDPSPITRLGLLLQRSFTRFLRGDLEGALVAAAEARPLHERLGGLPFVRHSLDWVQANVPFARGDHATVRTVLERRAADPDAADLDRRLGAPYLAMMARLLRLEGRTAELDRIVAEAEARTAGSIYAGPPAVIRLSVRAHAAWAAGDLPKAAEDLRQAAEIEERLRLVAFAGTPRLDLAILLLQGGRRDAALGELATVLATMAERGTLGLLCQAGRETVPLLELARERRVQPEVAAAALAMLAPRPGPASRPIPGSAEVLSGREVEVLRLLAAGASNRALADALVVSENTVKTHVARVLAKLDVHSRAQAAARARELRLI